MQGSGLTAYLWMYFDTLINSGGHAGDTDQNSTVWAGVPWNRTRSVPHGHTSAFTSDDF